ncbi:cytochrome c oxidase copper chaperone [Eupeodes corollae]|uniref:cytochrome c oxidase copper chaperone n=1 Tax=Eupeodes corollae TaxID=290404 RepID=UPI00248F8167|nr:cytochrome c oxidase copper chaperone [Eupeodes corollae]
MGNAPVKEAVQAAATNVTGIQPEKPKCKACCACPDTKRVRDQCIIERGEENCTKLIEAHKQCMRQAGFNI